MLNLKLLFGTLAIGAVLGLGGYTAHKFIVRSLENNITQLTTERDAARAEVTALRFAEEQNLETIATLEEQRNQQNEQITTLTVQNNAIIEERDRYLGIFRDHDLANLTRGRPDTIQRLANAETREVFRDIECSLNKDCDEEDN